MARFDVWMTERERAATLPNGLRVLREDSPRIRAIVWLPKATKPVWHFTFRSIEQRETKIAQAVVNLDANLARKAAEKAARKVGNLTTCDPGAVFAYSWGYDQTNVEFWQVIARRGSLVTLREISCQDVGGTKDFMTEHVVPVRDSFLPAPCVCKRPRLAIVHDENSAEPDAHAYEAGTPETITKRVQFYGGKPSLSFEHGVGSLVEFLTFGNADPLAARSHYRSHYA